MALITEDGTGRADADSLCSVADADAYHAGHGNVAWAALSVAAKEVALRNATSYMQQQYRLRWKGYRTTYVQALDWPRINVVLPDYYLNAYQLANTVPNEVKWACAELALRASTVALAPDLTRAQSKVTVGPVSVEYDPTSAESTRYRTVDGFLTPFLQMGGPMMKLERC